MGHGHEDRAADQRTSARECARELTECLDQQIALYEHLDTLGQSQSRMIEEEDTDGLLRTLAERQTAIEQIQHLNTRIKGVTDRWEEIQAALNDDERESIRRRMERIDTLIERVSERDESDRQRLSTKRDDVSTQIGRTRRGSTAVSAYGARSGAQGPRYQDFSG